MPLLREPGAPAPYQQIREILRKEIMESLSPGDRIAAERDLAKRFIANRATISRAITSLVNEGLLVRRVGRGTFVGSADSSSSRVRSRSVGLVVPNISYDFPSRLVRSAVKALRDENYRTVLFDSEDSVVAEASELERLMQEGLDGAFVLPIEMPDNVSLIARIIRLGMPLVILDRKPLGFEADLVATDNFSGAYRAVSKLIARGHTRIAHFTWLMGRNSTAIEERRRGYEQALLDHGIEIDPELICPPALYPDAQSSYKHVISYLRQDPRPITAIFALSDSFTAGAIAGCQALGLSIPDDIEVSGFFDGPESLSPDARFMRIVQDQEQIAIQAVELLMKRIDGEGPEGPQTITVRPHIIDIM